MNLNPVPALLLVPILLATGCSSMKATSEHNRNFDFGKIKTYQWIEAPAGSPENADTYLDEDIRKALDNELAKRDLQQVPEAADVQVAYYIKTKEHQEYASVGTEDHEFRGGFIYSKEHGRWNCAERDPELISYIVETEILTVLVYDAQNENCVWRGNLQTKIDRHQSKDKKQARIRKVAKKLIARLPAK